MQLIWPGRHWSGEQTAKEMLKRTVAEILATRRQRLYAGPRGLDHELALNWPRHDSYLSCYQLRYLLCSRICTFQQRMTDILPQSLTLRQRLGPSSRSLELSLVRASAGGYEPVRDSRACQAAHTGRADWFPSWFPTQSDNRSLGSRIRPGAPPGATVRESGASGVGSPFHELSKAPTHETRTWVRYNDMSVSSQGRQLGRHYSL